MLREAAQFYYGLCGLCPQPASEEYVTTAKTLCDEFKELKDKKPNKDHYWVKIMIANRICSINYHMKTCLATLARVYRG